MKRYVVTGSLMLLIGAAIIVAQDSIAVVADSLVADTIITTAVDSAAVAVNAVVEAIRNLQAGGSLAVYALGAAIVNLLLALIKIKPLCVWLGHEKMKPYKPLIALVLGLLLGFLTEKAAGQSILECVYAGIMMGMGSVGIHEFTRAPGISKLLKYIN